MAEIAGLGVSRRVMIVCVAVAFAVAACSSGNAHQVEASPSKTVSAKCPAIPNPIPQGGPTAPATQLVTFAATEVVLCRYTTDPATVGAVESHVLNGSKVATLEQAALRLAPALRPSLTLSPSLAISACIADHAMPLWLVYFSAGARVAIVSSRGDCVSSGSTLFTGTTQWQQAIAQATLSS